MLKIVFTILLPLLLPTLTYLTYMLLTGRHRAAVGATVGGTAVGGTAVGGAAETVRGAPWFWLLISGVALTAALLFTLALVGGHAPDRVYIPAHVDPDGRQVPARTVSPDSAPPDSAPPDSAPSR